MFAGRQTLGVRPHVFGYVLKIFASLRLRIEFTRPHATGFTLVIRISASVGKYCQQSMRKSQLHVRIWRQTLSSHLSQSGQKTKLFYYVTISGLDRLHVSDSAYSKSATLERGIQKVANWHAIISEYV